MLEMLKLLALAITATLCLSQDPGNDDYIACDDCQIPEGELPPEGQMVCFAARTVFKRTVIHRKKCTPQRCDFSDFFCVPRRRCDWEEVNITVPTCQLERRTSYRSIPRNWDSIVEIFSPGYFGNNGYPNNTYCVWNVADTGLVSYHIIDQQLQEPSNCSGPGCDCPDSVKISAGVLEIQKLCGSSSHDQLHSLSSNGLQVKFCSDNKQNAKGFLMMAATRPIIETSTQLSSVQKGIIRVKVGAPVYTIHGFNVTIVCNVIYGQPPITIRWLRNGLPDESRMNMSTIIVNDAEDGDVFTCRAENGRGYDKKDTQIYFAHAFCISG